MQPGEARAGGGVARKLGIAQRVDPRHQSPEQPRRDRGDEGEDGGGDRVKGEEAGGIDLIVIYNSGRYRMAGRGSLAGLLAYGNANEVVKEMAREVLPAHGLADTDHVLIGRETGVERDFAALRDELIAALSAELEEASGTEVIPISGASGVGVDWVLDKLLEAIPTSESPVDDDGEEEALEWSPLRG